MKTALLLLASLVPAFAIDGTVMNLTSGKPAAKATVTLYKLDQEGMAPEETVHTDQQGRFAFTKNIAGPRLLQAFFGGVNYRRVLPPGQAETGITLEVYDSSRTPGAARVAQHLYLLEPDGGEANVTEAFIYQNDGKTTYNDPEGGTLRFYLPPAVKSTVQVSCTSPQGMPIQRVARKSARPNVYTVDFPVKPGETRFQMQYKTALEGGVFEGRTLFTGQGPTRMATPSGVTLAGDGIESLGPEPQSQANIYEVKVNDFKVTLTGSGTLVRGQQQPESDAAASDGGGGPQIEQVPPRIYKNAVPILGLALGILALGFILLYRADEGKHEPRRSR